MKNLVVRADELKPGDMICSGGDCVGGVVKFVRRNPFGYIFVTMADGLSVDFPEEYRMEIKREE